VLDRRREELVVGILEDVSHVLRDLLERPPRHAAAAEDDLAGRRLEEPVQVLGERRLPGAVPPDERDELALAELELDVDERLVAVWIAVADAVERDERRAHARAPRKKARRPGGDAGGAEARGGGLELERGIGQAERREDARHVGRADAGGGARLGIGEER